MSALNSMVWVFLLGALLGVMVALLMVGLAVIIRPIQVGFKAEKISVQGGWFKLLEISAKQRLGYLSRCGSYDIKSGFELMRRDLSISSDLIALHQRRWFLPHWFLMWQVQRLPAETIYALFKHCVKLSNIPFDIEEKTEEKAEEKPAEKTEDSDDDWDYIDEEKKNLPAAPH